MIEAKFFGRADKLTGFRISGHSGLAESGSDIICAAVSAMSMLTINTLTERYGCEVKLLSEEKSALIDFEIISCPDKFEIAAHGLLEGLKCELESIGNDYPENIKVI